MHWYYADLINYTLFVKASGFSDQLAHAYDFSSSRFCTHNMLIICFTCDIMMRKRTEGSEGGSSKVTYV